MELKIHFEQIKPEYLVYIDNCKGKALLDPAYYSILLQEMSEGFINYVNNEEEIKQSEEMKMHDLLEYQIKLIESMNFNNDIVVKRLNKILNILVKEKHQNNLNFDDQPSVYLHDENQQNKESKFHYRKINKRRSVQSEQESIQGEQGEQTSVQGEQTSVQGEQDTRSVQDEQEYEEGSIQDEQEDEQEQEGVQDEQESVQSEQEQEGVQDGINVMII
jgi:hypothetical protein